MEIESPGLDVSDVFTAIFKGHQAFQRVQALAEVEHRLADDDFWFLFRVLWQDVEVLYPHHNLLRQMLTPDRLNAPDRIFQHSEAEQNVFRDRLRRGRPIKVYRGCTSRNVVGFSWTTNRAKAEAFAASTGWEKSLITVGKLDPRRIVMALNDRGDAEIVAFPEHVVVERMDDFTGRVGDEFATMVKAHGLPAHIQAQRVRDVYEAPEKLAEVISTLERERDYLRALGFSERPTYLDGIIGLLTKPLPAEAA